MHKPLSLRIALLTIAAPSWGGSASPPVPDAVVDLQTAHGAALVGARWSTAEPGIVTAATRFGGQQRETHDLDLRPDRPGFDEAAWERIEPESLSARRTGGLLSFAWYRTTITVPDRIGEVDCKGAEIVLEIVADDYAEIWIDGRLPLALGERTGRAASGWNAPSRVLLATNARPGQHVDVAVFAANGPLSAPPNNRVWIRSATLDVYSASNAAAAHGIEPASASVERYDATADEILPAALGVERVADGLSFAEGPVWTPDDSGGKLLFSDPNQNVIHRWSAADGLSISRTKSGYAGIDIGRYRQPGSNGLALDPQGRLTICEHGNRRVTRLEPNGDLTVLADRFDGRRLNSPNDLVWRSDGALFFTDPFFGLPGFGADPARELPFTAVFCLLNGELRAVDTDLTGPNGIALSPDERFLYVGNWDDRRKTVTRYELAADGSLHRPTVILDLADAPGDEAIDGVETDAQGNLYVAGPGGAWLISPEGTRLALIRLPELPANFAWGDDGATLYVAARSSVYRFRPLVPGPSRK